MKPLLDDAYVRACMRQEVRAKELAAERAAIREAEAQEALLTGRAELAEVQRYARRALAGMRWRHGAAVVLSGQPVSLFRLPSGRGGPSATPVLQQASPCPCIRIRLNVLVIQIIALSSSAAHDASGHACSCRLQCAPGTSSSCAACPVGKPAEQHCVLPDQVELLAATATVLACMQFQRDRGLFERYRRAPATPGRSGGGPSMRFANVVEVHSLSHPPGAVQYCIKIVAMTLLPLNINWCCAPAQDTMVGSTGLITVLAGEPKKAVEMMHLLAPEVSHHLILCHHAEKKFMQESK